MLPPRGGRAVLYVKRTRYSRGCPLRTNQQPTEVDLDRRQRAHVGEPSGIPGINILTEI